MNLEKLLIINWKFPDDYVTEWNVEKNDHHKVICLNCKSTQAFNRKIKDYKSELALILLHDNEPQNKVSENDISLPEGIIKKTTNKFKGGQEKIYLTEKDKGLLGVLTLDEHCIQDGKIKITNFEVVWDWYWNKLNIEYQKKKIINLWLPLAIDIQGLSEIKDKENIEEYLKDVLNDIEKIDIKKFCKDWKEISEVLSLNGGEQLLDKEYQLSATDIEKINPPPFKDILDEEIPSRQIISLKNFVANNFKKANTEKDFLPKLAPGDCWNFGLNSK